MTQQSASRRLTVFFFLWLGQVVSLFGSGLTSFALGVWVYQQTGSASQFALILFSASLPAFLVSPVVGALVDRWNRRWVLILSDAGSAVATVAIVLLLWSDRLAIWHIYVAVAVSAVFQAFQPPAFAASTTLLVAKKHFARASGMILMGQAVAQLLAPVTAGFLLVSIQLAGIIVIDIATFVFAVILLLLVRIPQPKTTAEGAAAKGSLTSESAFGWTYIKSRKGLLGMLVMFAAYNFSIGILAVLLTPLVLSFASAQTLGVVLSVAGTGLVLGGLVMTVTGGPRRRMRGIYLTFLVLGPTLFLGGLRESAAVVAIAAFIFMFGAQVVNASAQAIWQSKVAPDVQGRVFAIRRMVAMAAIPAAYLVGGPLAEYVFEPLLMPGGPLADTVGRLIGVGPGRGTGLLFIVLGFYILLVVFAGYRYSPLRNIETELPDAIGDDAADLSRDV